MSHLVGAENPSGEGTRRSAAAFPKALLAVGAGLMIVRPADPDRDRWIEREPQAWLRQWVGPEVRQPLHRLRSLYAADLAN